MAKKTNNNNNQTSNIPTENMQSASVNNTPNTNEVNKAVESARKAIEDLGDSVKKTNTDLKELNNQLGKRSRANNVKKLLDEIEKLTVVLDELNKVEVPTDKVNEIQTTLDKLTKTKFNTTEITKVTNVLANFNTELSTLSTHLRNLNNIKPKTIETVIKATDVDRTGARRNTQQTIDDLRGKKEADLITRGEYKKLLTYEKVKPLERQLKQAEDNDEKDYIQSQINDAYKEIGIELKRWSSEKRKRDAANISNDRAAGTQQAKADRAAENKNSAKNNLEDFRKEHAKEIENNQLLLDEFKEYTSLQVKAGELTENKKKELDATHAKRIKSEEAYIQADKELTEFSKKYAEEIEKSILPIELFRYYTSLQVAAYKKTLDEKILEDNAHKEYLKWLKVETKESKTSSGRSKVPELNKQKSTEESKREKKNRRLSQLEKDYLDDKLGKKEIYEMLRLKVELNEITGKELDDLIKQYKIDSKRLELEEELARLKEIEEDNEILSFKQQLRKLDLQVELGEITDAERETLTKMLKFDEKKAEKESELAELKDKEWKGELLSYKQQLRKLTLQAELGEITDKQREDTIAQLRLNKKTLKAQNRLNELEKLEADKVELSLRQQNEKLRLLVALGKMSDKEAENKYKELKLEEALVRDKAAKLGRFENSKDIRDLRRKESEEYNAKKKADSQGLFSANRGVISQRNRDRDSYKLDLDKKLLQSEIDNRKKNAKARIANKITGKIGVGDTSLLSDLAEITGLANKDSKTLSQLKIEKQTIKDNQSAKIREITDDEREKQGKINRANIPNNKKEEHLKRLSEKASAKRQKINDEANEALVKNEELTATTTNKLAGKLAMAGIALKGFEKTVKALAKVSNEAANSQADLVSNLQSMGASSDSLNLDSITWYTNELKQIEARWKNIKNNIGDMFTESLSGILIVFEGILNGLDSVSNWLEKTFGWKSNNSTDLEKEEKKNQSAAKMLKIVESLEKGVITKNGLKVVVDRETSSKALNSIFSSANSLGIDNTSAGNLTSQISDMALEIYSKHGGDYGAIMQQLQDAIFNGSNAAAQYGINVDDQVLTGWAANTKGLDLANVQYTEAYKAALRFQLAQEEMTDGNSDAMTKQIKRWKQLGDVIQTASGTLFEFQEVQTLQAKDFTIPEINNQGNISNGSFSGDVDELKTLNEAISDTKQLYVLTADGIKTFEEALKYVEYDLDKIVLLYDEANNKMYLASSDYLPSLTDAEKNHIKELDSGISAIATYARHLGLTDQEMINLARDAGLSETQVGALKVSLDKLTEDGYTLKFDYSDITEAKKEAEELNRLLANRGYTNSGNVDTSKPNSYASELSKFTEPIQKYINNGYKFSDGSTIEDLNGNGNTAWWDLGDYWEWLTNSEKHEAFNDMVNMGHSPELYGRNADVSADMADWPGMANGGISTKAHLTAISEGNANEAVIPLDSSIGINALSSAMQIALGGVGSGINIENLNINNEGINIAENENQWRQVGNRIYEEISTIQRERGDMNYGIK